MPDGRTRAYVIYQSLQAHPGGAAGVTAWALQALRDDYDVRLATPDGALDLALIDDAYGTSLAEMPVILHQLPEPALLRWTPRRALKSVRLAATLRDRHLHQAGRLVVNLANEMSFAPPAVSYIHCPIRNSRVLGELYGGPERLLRLANTAAFKVVSGFSKEQFRQSICLANSRWTAAAIRRGYGIDATVVYPPVTLPLNRPRRLDQRSPGFVVVSRISPEKRVHESVEVVTALRQAGHDVHLHIVGAAASAYGRSLRERTSGLRYVRWHSELARSDLADLLNRHRFGLHLMRNEHFGMAVAEMAVAGVQVIAHRSAGPLEIFGTDYPLLVHDVGEAIQVASDLLDHPARQHAVLDYLHRQRIGRAFTPEVFMRSIRQAASAAIASGTP